MSLSKPDVLIVGGGMITHDQILPTMYHMQRSGAVREITVCASRPRTVQALAKAEPIRRAFPGQTFRALPDSGDPDASQPGLYRDAIGRMPPRQVVIAAVPD